MGDILYLITVLVLLFFGIRLMSNGWGLMTEPIERPEPPKKPTHPEMEEVKDGEELMVVNFEEKQPTDPLYKSLQQRIDTLNDERIDTMPSEYQPPGVDDEEDDDDDGGDVVALSR
tara:strand:- start:1176 stop:1523 length:348 start_codon:yes stop_codon:yes gene_type:complete